MSKTSDVIELLESGENDTAKIKEQTGASESLITRCRNRLEKQKYRVPKQEEAKGRRRRRANGRRNRRYYNEN
ncbi:hypothetical protein OBGAJBEG_00008 [Methanosarcina spherical virus]|nr:hypothetical protein OBGAJBEG_00008 [Methanosarcina spherical virus]